MILPMVSKFSWVYSNSIAGVEFPRSRYHTPYNTTHPYGYKATSSLGSFRHLRFGAPIVSFVLFVRSFLFLVMIRALSRLSRYALM